MAVENIGHRDLGWSLIATILKVGAGILLYPFILTMLPAETVGVWTIFMTINMLAMQLDFGFNQSFARNISYIFSGVTDLKKEGHLSVSSADKTPIDYNLLKGTIRAMRYFYLRMAGVLALISLSVGSVYVYFVAQSYSGSKMEIYASWLITCLYNCFMLYTLYYESLMNGRGMVKRINQVIICGNIAYIGLAIVLLYLGCGLLAIVSSQLVSVLIIRLLSYLSFYDKNIKAQLSQADDSKYRYILQQITPNAIKVGLTSLGGFVINRASVFIGSLCLSLSVMASFGITMQIVTLVCYISHIYTRCYLPKVNQWRVEDNMLKIKRTYNISSLFLVAVFVLSGVAVVWLGNDILKLMRCKTLLLPAGMMILLWIQNLLESNHANAAQYLLSKNEVPFFKASLISAAATLVLLLIMVVWLDWGVWGMILAPTIAQAAYQNWRWPAMVINEFKSVR